jgi:hypothetical protein
MPLCAYMLVNITHKETNKQTNKQTNKNKKTYIAIPIPASSILVLLCQ